jgi:hypothetical protein
MTKVSALAETTSLDGTEYLAVVQTGTSKKAKIRNAVAGASNYYMTTMTTSGTGTANLAAFNSDVVAAMSAGKVLYVPYGDYQITGSITVPLTAGLKNIVRGDGRLLINTGSTSTPIIMSGLGEHNSGTPNELTVSAVANVVASAVANLDSSTAEVTKVTVSDATGLVRGQMVSLVADVIVQYSLSTWTNFGSSAIPDEWNWQHEMARVLSIVGNDVYLDCKLAYSAASYNGANFKALRFYPVGTLLDWSGIKFAANGTTDDINTSSAVRPKFTVGIFGIDQVKWNVDFDSAWAGTVQINSVVEPRFKSHAETLANGYSGGSVLGYHPCIDGAVKGGEFEVTIGYGGRHAGTTTWLEETRYSIANTAYVAGASTVLSYSYSGTGNAPEVNDRVYLDMSGVTGTLNTMPIGTYLVTARSGTTSGTITVNFNSTGLTYSAGTGLGVPFQWDAHHRYGSIIGANIKANASNTFGALLDPHENAIDVTYEGSATSSNAYSWSTTSGRTLNTRGLRDIFQNIKQRNMAGFVSTDSFARQYNSTNICRIENVLLYNQMNASAGNIAYFEVVGASVVSDKRELHVKNVEVNGMLGKFLNYYQSSADKVIFDGIKMNADWLIGAAIPTKNMMTVQGGIVEFNNCTFDFSYVTSSDYIRFLENTTNAANITFNNCTFKSIPSPSTAPNNYFFDMEVTGASITFKDCNFSFVGAGTSLRWLKIGTGFSVTVTYDSCNFTGMDKVFATTGLAYGNSTGSVSNIIERNCTYDLARVLTSNASATLAVASDKDVLVSTVSNTSTTETTLRTRNIPANTMNMTGKTIRFRAWGTTTNNANTKTLRVKFGTTTIFTRTMTTLAANTWSIEGEIVSTGTSAQSYVIRQMQDGATAITPSSGTMTETSTGLLAFAITGQSGTASSDISLVGSIIEVL